jgi:hypothetical protein
MIWDWAECAAKNGCCIDKGYKNDKGSKNVCGDRVSMFSTASPISGEKRTLNPLACHSDKHENISLLYSPSHFKFSGKTLQNTHRVSAFKGLYLLGPMYSQQ